MDLNEAKKHLLEFSHQRAYEALCVFINSEIDKLHLKLEVVRDPLELGIIQGRVKNYRQMLQLEKEVSNL